MYEYGCTVTRVVDGDTIDVVLDLGFSILHKCRVRLYGIDTPESRTRDKDEKARGKLAAKYLGDAIHNGTKVVLRSKLKDSKGKRYIFVSKSCKTMIKGLQRQIYKENTNIPDKEQGFDHMNDALGYLIDFIKPLTSNVSFSKPTRWAIK